MNDFCLIPGHGLKALHLDPNFHWMTKPPSPLGGVYMTPWRLSRRRDYTPVPSHGSIFVYVIPPQNVMPARVTPAWVHPGCCAGARISLQYKISQRYPVNEKRQDTRCELSSLAANDWIAEELNQRGEIWRQHVKAHSCSHFSPCFDHTSLTLTDDGTSQIDHDIGAYVPFSFRTMSRVLLRPHPTGVQGWRRQDRRLNLIAQWRDHLYWERSFTASMISPVF